MLSVNTYTKEYIDTCRTKVEEALEGYRKSGSTSEVFAFIFFNNLVVVLDNYFSNRSRTLEGKNGNPVNEVRVLCNSMMLNNNLFADDKTIKLDPKKSILGYKEGDEIKLKQEDFLRLYPAFFEEIEKRYLEK